MTDSVRLRGTGQLLAAGRLAFRRVALRSGEDTSASFDEGEFDLALSDGGVAVIETPRDGLKLIGATNGSRSSSSSPLSSTILRGAWSELRDRPEAKGLVHNIVAPFAAVELETTAIEPGQFIEVYGTAFEYAFEEATDTLRSAASKHPSRVLAQIVVVGDQPEHAMRAMTTAIAELTQAAAPSKPNAPPQVDDPGDPAQGGEGAGWVLLGAALIPVAGCLVAAHYSASATEAWKEEVVAVTWSALAVSVRPWREAPRFRTREKKSAETSEISAWARLIFAVMPLMIVAFMWGPRSHGLSSGTLLALSTVFFVGWFSSEVAWRGHAHRMLATLAGGPRMTFARTKEQTGTCEGIVRDPTPVEIAGNKVALMLVTKMKKGFGRRNPDVVGEEKLIARGTFVLEAKDGLVEIDPDECQWATTLRQAPPKPTGDYETSEWIPVGGRIAAHGHFFRSPSEKKGSPALRLRSVGTNPAIIVATGPRGDPLRLASRIVWHRRLTLLGLALAAAALAVLALRLP